MPKATRTGLPIRGRRRRRKTTRSRKENRAEGDLPLTRAGSAVRSETRNSCLSGAHGGGIRPAPWFTKVEEVLCSVQAPCECDRKKCCRRFII